MELDVIDIPVKAAVCNEPLSCVHQHRMQVFYNSLSVAIVKSSQEEHSYRKIRRGKKMGWNKEMKNLKRAASKDYYLWKAAGKPRQGDMYETMVKSRKLFKSRVQNLK